MGDGSYPPSLYEIVSKNLFKLFSLRLLIPVLRRPSQEPFERMNLRQVRACEIKWREKGAPFLRLVPSRDGAAQTNVLQRMQRIHVHDRSQRSLILQISQKMSEYRPSDLFSRDLPFALSQFVRFVRVCMGADDRRGRGGTGRGDERGQDAPDGLVQLTEGEDGHYFVGPTERFFDDRTQVRFVFADTGRVDQSGRWEVERTHSVSASY